MSKLSRVTTIGALALLLASCNNGRGTGPIGGCNEDSDCLETDEICSPDGICVGCFEDANCDCHEICDNNSCVPFGAENATDDGFALNAHGTWNGTPGGSDYTFQELCAEDNDCDVLGDFCNPFTAGCISPNALDRDGDGLPDGLNCGVGNPCADGFECDASRLPATCFPAAMCRGNGNCCGGDGTFLCNAAGGSTGLCVPAATECTPPTAITSQCPMAPRESGGICDDGLPCCDGAEFCSFFGECVQCVCDFDCNPAGADNGTKCYGPERRCRSESYCLQNADCAADEACDAPNTACKPSCTVLTEPTVCTTTEFCNTDFNVCRPLTEKPCEPDLYEPNDTLAEAIAENTVLQPPPPNDNIEVQGFSLCGGEDDWFLMTLQRGDRIVMAGRGVGPTQGVLSAYGPDQISRIGIGFFGADQSFLEFTVNVTGTHYLNVSPLPGTEGFYDLTIDRTSAPVCDDPFEELVGFNDTPAEATPIYDYLNPQPFGSCSLASGGGGVQLVNCSLDLCPGDTDYYAVNVPNGGDIEARIEGFAGDLDLALFGPFENLVDLNNGAAIATTIGPNAIETVTDTARPAGWYLLRVFRTSGEQSEYQMELQIRQAATPCPEDPYEDEFASAGGPTPPTTVVDADGLNDSFAGRTQVALLPGEVVQLDAAPLSLCRNDIDWFELGQDSAGAVDPVRAGQRLEISVEVAPGSPADIITLAAGTSDGNLVYGSDDPFAPVTSVVISPTAGSTPYVVKISGSTAAAAHVAYTLRVNWVEPPTCDVDSLGDLGGAGGNDVPADAFALVGAAGWPQSDGDEFQYSAPGPEPLSLCAGGDDWYRINVPGGTQLIAWTLHNPTQADLALAVYDDSVDTISDPGLPSSGLLDISERAAEGYQQVRTRQPIVGDAYLVVQNRTGWPLLDYQLGAELITLACFEDEYETPIDNDDFATATPVPLVQQPYDAQLELSVLSPLAMCSAAGAEQDFYSVPLEPGDQVTGRVFYDPNEGEIDLRLHAPGPEGLNNILRSDNDNDQQPTGELEVQYTTTADDPAGPYLLLVVPDNNPRNYYYLEVQVRRSCVDDTFEPAPPAELATPPYTPGSTRNMTLCFDEDWIQLDVPGGVGDVTVCTGYDPFDVFLALEVHNDLDTTRPAVPVGTDLLDDSRQFAGAERVVIPRAITTAATYYVRTYPAYPRQPPFEPPHPFHADYTLTILEGDVVCP